MNPDLPPQLSRRLYQALGANAKRPALKVAKHTYTYAHLRNMCGALSDYLQEQQITKWAMLCQRSITCYQAFGASLLSGITLVPLTSNVPVGKSAFIIEHSQCSTLVVDAGNVNYAANLLLCELKLSCLEQLRILLSERTREKLTFKLQELYTQERERLASTLGDASTERAARALLAQRLTVIEQAQETCECLNEDPAVYADSMLKAPQVNPEQVLYILYTSGTTGHPKGIAINYGSYSHYLNNILKLYEFKDSDVFSHFADLTFDISFQDPLCAWISGALLVCPSKGEILNPWKFINKNHITIVHTVPSMVKMLKLTSKHSAIKTNTKVRLSIFTGEALWFSQLESYCQFFTKSRLFDAYGPTEATVEATYNEIDPHSLKLMDNTHVLVPLGRAFKGVKLVVVDENLQSVPVGQTGNLLIGWPQVACGYYQDIEKTQESFICYQGERYFNTGDVVYLEAKIDPLGKSYEELHYLGRNDDLVKIEGYRVSIYEVEEYLSKLCCQEVKVAAYYSEREQRNYLAAFFTQELSVNLDAIRAQACNFLSSYMIPKDFILCPSFELNANGKVDRKQMLIKYASKLSGT